MNEEVYAAPTTQLRVEPNRFSAWLKGRSAALHYWLAPKHMIKTMAQATGEYCKELNADASERLAAFVEAQRSSAARAE
ncbi:hypothetical protein [Pseudomonas poae]|uniref:hypothetical protein n=1 Tax=Pseudomonas poae TaxID=200451 RepID=UPI0030D53D7C